MTQTLFSTTKPQCIGRYLIDVPGSFNNILKDMVFIDEFKIESQRLYRPSFEQRIQLREKELYDSTNKPGNDSIDGPFLKEVIRLPDEKGVIFDRNEPGTPDSYRQLEAHVYSGMTAFVITADIRDYSAPKNKERKSEYLSLGFTEAQSNTKPVILSAMRSLISRLSGRKDDEIPVDKGVCIPDGFIKDNGGIQKEKLTFRYVNDDFSFGMKIDNTIKKSDDTFFSRSDNINESAHSLGKQTIRKNELSPGGIPSQEWLFRGVQSLSDEGDKTAPLYSFILFSNESIAAPNKPWTNVELSSIYKNTRYSEAQMVEIWDKLVSTIRYRPNAY
ncbi:T6SS immunity protein Tli4 family protein [Buttiauxella massiliensis]|uniref:T6SS immunity protein Tli4 family protein n=1 Tax=Buttiauxella massiliensis TaxID=2831590 RepID=UPI00186A133E|nr:T6SS immunity protein Tli4 family protein [Buttiauxella massiliensis]